jgi:hypothetical protein
VLPETLRAFGLAATELARVQAGTIGLKLLKVGAVVVRNSRRVRLWLSPGLHLAGSVLLLRGLLLRARRGGAGPGTR